MWTSLQLAAAIVIGSLAGVAVADALPAERDEPVIWWRHEMQGARYEPPECRKNCTRDGRPQRGQACNRFE